MHTVDAFEKEIMMQLDFLKQFKPQRTLSVSKQKRSIFCGTGDSYASAQLAEIFSNFRAKALDPLDILKNKRVAERHDLYLISISGNTISNINLAKRHRNSTAITANPKSKLARNSKKVIPLKFENAGIQTSGSISFLSSALTCISLVTRCEIGNFSDIFEKAMKAAKKIRLRGKTFVLGGLYTMPVAMFCAAKLYEVLGANAMCERIEQFCHMGLFSARKGDSVFLFEKKNPHNEKLERFLRGCGLHVTRFDVPAGNHLDEILYFVFVSELIALYAARRKRKQECFFVEAKKLRNASSSMITDFMKFLLNV